MINMYCSFKNITILQIKTIIEKLFPDNKSKIFEDSIEEVFVSDGSLFECSLESSLIKNEKYFSANYHSNLTGFLVFLGKFIEELNAEKIIYNIDYEREEDGKYIEQNIRHPNFEKSLNS